MLGRDVTLRDDDFALRLPAVWPPQDIIINLFDHYICIRRNNVAGSNFNGYWLLALLSMTRRHFLNPWSEAKKTQKYARDKLRKGI